MNNKVDVIILCGLDGSGKTTQALKLIKFLQNKKIKCKYVHLRYPNILILPFAGLVKMMGMSVYPLPIKKKNAGIKNLNEHKFLVSFWKRLLYLDFKFSKFFKISRRIKQNYIMILDRYVIDALIDLVDIMGDEHMQELSTQFLKLIPLNSKIFYLDIEPQISYQRREDEEIKILENRRRLYHDLSKILPICIIDAKKPIDEIHSYILEECNLK